MNDMASLDRLRELRETAGLTQSDMARLCGLRGQQSHQTAGAWERGTMIPSPSRRVRFIGYLWDHLHLRDDPAQFEAVWEMLVEAWDWEPITDAEWAHFTPQPRPPKPDPHALDERLAQLEAALAQHDAPAPAPAALSLPLDDLPPVGPLPPGSRMPLARNPLFVGRRADLLRLAAALSAHSTAAISQVETAAATGMGGIGKTQLASEFVHRYGRFFAGGVFWLSFESGEAVASEVAACGGVGALDLRPDFANRSLDEQVRLVQAAWQEPAPRLLVFDNCEEPELLAAWRPTSGGCRLIVTSRRHDWDLALGVHVQSLAVLRRVESVQLLRQHRVDAPPEILDALAAELGDLPLALHLAGSYLRRYSRVLSAEQYLRHLRDPTRLAHPSLQTGSASPTGHIQHVARTFALSYEQLDEQVAVDACARRLLIHLSCLAPGEAAPYSLPAATLGLDLNHLEAALQMEDGVARLLELGLVEVDEQHNLRLHRLLGDFVRQVAGEVGPPAQAEVEAVIQAHLDASYAAVTPLTLLPIEAHLRHVVDTALGRGDASSATLSHALGKHLWQLGDFAAARAYMAQGLTIRQAVCGAHHADTAASHHLLGVVMQETGEVDQAYAHLQEALAIRLATVGEDHFDTADTLANLGEFLWGQQRLAAAVAHLERALSICGRVVDKDDPLVAELANILALCLLESGQDGQEARRWMEQALTIRRHRLGEEHPYTAAIYTNLGYLLHEIGEWEAAGRHYEQGLAIRRRTLGDEHVDTAHSLYCLGRLRRMQERWHEAHHYLERALTLFLNSQGDEYTLTASCLNELGAVLIAQNDLPRARRCLDQALAIRQKVFHAGHSYIANTLHNLGLLLLALGQTDAAQQQLEQALAICRQTPDPDSPHTADILITLGQVAQAQRDEDLADTCYTQALAICTHRLSAVHPLTQRVVSLQAHPNTAHPINQTSSGVSGRPGEV